MRPLASLLFALALACGSTPSVSNVAGSRQGLDGDPATTERIDAVDAAAVAIEVSRARFPAGGTAAHVVLARDDDFADSLAGSPLSNLGPLLYTPTGALDDDTLAEIRRVLPDGASVYLLGGPAALSDQVATTLEDAGYAARRLAGPTRYETAAAVVTEVLRLDPGADRIAIARGDAPPDNPTAAWADAVTAGAWTARDAVPVLVTPSGALHPAASAVLRDVGAEAVLLGGESALSSAVADAVAEATDRPARRVSGSTRAGTATAIATQLVGIPTAGPRQYVIVDGYRDDGWGYGLVGGGLAADADAAILLVGHDVPPETAAAVSTCGMPAVDLVVLGSVDVVTPAVVDALTALDGDSCANASPGPRALPASFVALETDGFPRPAAEACADAVTTIQVGPGESIADALSQAAPGTTVRVAGGTYVESPEDFRALAMEVDDVCLRGDAGSDVVLRAGPGQGYGLEISASHVVVEGLTLEGFETSVSLTPPDGGVQRAVTLERLRVRDPVGEFREGIIAFGEGDPSGPPVHDGLLLLDVVVDGVDFGVSCNAGPCAHWWLEDVRVLGRGSTEGGSGADAVAIEEGRQIVVVDSTVSGVAADGIDTKADDVVLLNVEVRDVGRNGIKSWRGVDVLNALVAGTGADAALVGEEGARYRYAHVTVTGHEPGGFGYVGTWSYDAREPVQLEIINSIMADNALGGLFVVEGATVELRNNLFADVDARLLQIDGTEYGVADLAQLESDGLGADNLPATSPGFVDPAAGDHRLRPDSPAVDRGAPLSGLELDLDQRPRVQGAGPDLGPYETG